MFLPDDDIDGLNLNHVPVGKSDENNDNHLKYKPIKQVVCKFFIPKIKKPFEKINYQNKQGFFTDIDDCRMFNYDYLDSRINDERISIFDNDDNINNNGEEELGFIGNGFRNVLNLQSVVLSDLLKQESFVKNEKSLLPMQPPFSPSNSSQSNLPNTLGSYSKSSKSITDSDNNFPETAQITSNLIVKDVFSINNPSDMSENVNTRLSSLDSCSKLSDNSINKEKISESENNFDKKSQSKPPNKVRKRSNHFSDSKSIKKKKARQVSNNSNPEKTKNLIRTNPAQCRLSISSGSDTDPMIEEITETKKISFDSIEPCVVLDLLFMDKFLVEKSKREKSKFSTKSKSKKKEIKQIAANNKKTKKLESRTRKCHKRKAKSEKFVSSKDNKLSFDKNPDVLNNTNLCSNELIYCFSCKSTSRTFCKLHPVRWIINENIHCPFVDYNIDESFDKYFRPQVTGVDCKQCNCNKNELEHLLMSLPKPFKLKESDKSGIAIWTKCKLNRGTVIGPYIGELTDDWRKEALRPTLSLTRELPENTNPDDLCLQHVFKSNWLRFINFTSDKEQSNLHILRYDGKIFCQTIKAVNTNTELVVCKKLKIDLVENRRKCVPKSFPSCDKGDLVDLINITHPKSLKSSTENLPTKQCVVDEKVTKETPIILKKSHSSPKSLKSLSGNLPTKPFVIDEKVSKETSIMVQQDHCISKSLKASSGNLPTKPFIIEKVSKETSIMVQQDHCISKALKASSGNLLIKECVVDENVSKETSVILPPIRCTPISLKPLSGNLLIKQCVGNENVRREPSVILQQNHCNPITLQSLSGNLPIKPCVVDEKVSNETSVMLQQNPCSPKSLKPSSGNLPKKPCVVDEKVSKETSVMLKQNPCSPKSLKASFGNLPIKPCVVDEKVSKETSVMLQQNPCSPKSLKPSSGNLPMKPCVVDEKMKLETSPNLQRRPDISTKEALNTDRQKYSGFGCIPKNHLPKFEFEENAQRPGNTSFQFDKEIIIYTAKLLSEMSTIPTSKINELLSKKFPNKPKLSDQYVKQMVYDLNLRPLKGLSSNVDRDMIEALVEMFVDNPKMTFTECQNILMKLFPSKPRLSTKTIERYLKLNNCRVKEEEISFTVDIEVLEEVKKVINESKSVSVHLLFKEVSQRFPHNPSITMQYIDYLVQTFQLKKKGSEVKFIEDRRFVGHKTNHNNPINPLPANKITVTRSLLNTDSLVPQSTV